MAATGVAATALEEEPAPGPRTGIAPEAARAVGRATPVLDASPLGPEFENVGRNDPCPCGSGKKFKKCHGATG
jgi:preprotein translocase subunit SecA